MHAADLNKYSLTDYSNYLDQAKKKIVLNILNWIMIQPVVIIYHIIFAYKSCFTTKYQLLLEISEFKFEIHVCQPA